MKKLNEEQKAKLIYSGELALFALVFIALGILMILGILGKRDLFKQIFPWVTLVGSALLYADFITVLAIKKRRQNNALIDKILLLPSATCTLAFDIIVLIKGPLNINDLAGFNLYGTYVGSLFIYFGAIYIFEAIYHYYKPIPGLLDDDKKEEKIVDIPAKPEENDEKQD